MKLLIFGVKKKKKPKWKYLKLVDYLTTSLIFLKTKFYSESYLFRVAWSLGVPSGSARGLGTDRGKGESI